MYLFDFWVECLNENIIDSQQFNIVDLSIDRQRDRVKEKDRYL